MRKHDRELLKQQRNAQQWTIFIIVVSISLPTAILLILLGRWVVGVW